MGNKIAPRFQAGDKQNKMLREALVSRLSEEVVDDNGAVSTLYDVMAARLVATACYAQSDKDAISAAKLVFERVEGKAAVADTTQKVEIPAVKFILRDEELGLIEDKSRGKAGPEEDEPGKIVVSIDGMDGVMEF